MLRLPLPAPYDWRAQLAFRGARAIAGVEETGSSFYRRSDRGERVVTFTFMKDGLIADETSDDAAVRRTFDLDRPGDDIERVLSADPLLAPLIAARPGLRLPVAWDPFELAVRAVAGQQISVAATRTVLGTIAARFGEPIANASPAIRLSFPGPERLASVKPEELPMPRRRARSIVALSRAVADGEVTFGAPLQAEALERLPGIGSWTAQYIAMRASGDGDAFPASDLVLRRVFESLSGETASRLAARAERWRPYRAYAALHLWSAAA